MSTPKWNPEVYEREIRKEVERVSKPKRQRETGGNGGDRREQARTPPKILPPPNMPMKVARAFVTQQCTGDADALILRHWRGGWWAWQGSHWVERERIGRFAACSMHSPSTPGIARVMGSRRGRPIATRLATSSKR
jgi:hypothetical protein